MPDKKFYTTTDAAKEAGVSRDTILRWLRDHKIPEPARDRNGWRIFSKEELKAIVRYATKITPSPHRIQGQLFKQRRRS